MIRYLRRSLFLSKYVMRSANSQSSKSGSTYVICIYAYKIKKKTMLLTTVFNTYMVNATNCAHNAHYRVFGKPRNVCLACLNVQLAGYDSIFKVFDGYNNLDAGHKKLCS